MRRRQARGDTESGGYPDRDIQHGGRLVAGKREVAVLGGMTVILSKFDKARASDYLGRCAQAANESENFKGSSAINKFVMINGFHYGYGLYKDFSFSEAFARLGPEYFDQTLAAASGLNDKLARAIAMTAACDKILQQAPKVVGEEKKAGNH